MALNLFHDAKMKVSKNIKEGMKHVFKIFFLVTVIYIFIISRIIIKNLEEIDNQIQADLPNKKPDINANQINMEWDNLNKLMVININQQNNIDNLIKQVNNSCYHKFLSQLNNHYYDNLEICFLDLDNIDMLQIIYHKKHDHDLIYRMLQSQVISKIFLEQLYKNINFKDSSIVNLTLNTYQYYHNKWISQHSTNIKKLFKNDNIKVNQSCNCIEIHHNYPVKKLQKEIGSNRLMDFQIADHLNYLKNNHTEFKKILIESQFEHNLLKSLKHLIYNIVKLNSIIYNDFD